jgi:hypothetical protein
MKLLKWTIAIAAISLGVGQTRASQMTWGPAMDITGDTDVITSGNLVGAFSFATSVPSTTVNGVTFVGMPSPYSSGNFTFTVTGVESFGGAESGANAAPYNTLSPSYQTLLSQLVGTMDVNDQLHLTMSGLRPGDSYQFEWWFNFSFPPNFIVTATAGNSVTLLSNTSPTSAIGSLGQYAVGSFTADGTGSEVITFTGNRGGFLNGFQLRDDVVSTPEPASLTLLGTGLLAFGGFRLRRWRRKPSAA